MRQWVLSLLIPLGSMLPAQPKLVTPVLQVVHCVITCFLLNQAGLMADQADSGAVNIAKYSDAGANLKDTLCPRKSNH
jgi:hypothetical protein